MAYIRNSISGARLRAGCEDAGRAMMRPMARHSGEGGEITSRERGVFFNNADVLPYRSSRVLIINPFSCRTQFVSQTHLDEVHFCYNFSDGCFTSAHLHEMISQQEPSRCDTSLMFPDSPSAARTSPNATDDGGYLWDYWLKVESLRSISYFVEFSWIIHELRCCD